MRKWFSIILYVSCTILAFIYRYDILSWMKEDHNLFSYIGIATLLALFPVVPYKAVIGFFGYAYGSLVGALICWLATNLAAAILFGVVKYLFQSQARAFLASKPALEKFTAGIERRPFASIVLVRLVPIIPQTAVNIYAGAAGLPFWSYIVASGIGKMPGIALYAFLGDHLLQNPGSAITAIIVYAAVIILAGLSLRPRSQEAKNCR
ncbi:VTT domain-containing protein [Paenibacillus sp. FSL K6-0276]|uniref:TVP38/TMEM64 family protein n=1 Tax=unclassified Paenibacillus TaxID=185978 RepID=UPI0028A70F1E|nr:VTT domain-containing protein [Paenibacillus sp.]